MEPPKALVESKQLVRHERLSATGNKQAPMPQANAFCSGQMAQEGAVSLQAIRAL